MIKKHDKIIPAELINMGGNKMFQALPAGGVDDIDPFLLIHHWYDQLPGDEHPRRLGVGPHPHRGFSPVTMIFQGELHHRDSAGNSSIVGAGGTQWMFAGKGITHSERPSQKMAQEGGDFEIIQFWVNTPAKNKMEMPKYIALEEETTPWYTSDDQKVKLGLLTGAMFGLKGPIDHHTPTTIARISFKNEGEITLDIPNGYNSLLYIMDGFIKVNNELELSGRQSVSFQMEGNQIQLKAQSDVRVLLLAGKPIEEKRTSYGPFVMNTETEIMQAIRDERIGKMGFLVEEF